MKKSERRKLSPDGLPIDPREWLAEDWRDLHEAIERIKKRVGERHAKVAAPAEPDYRKQLRKLCGLMATVQRENEERWMELACQFLNECLAVLGDKDRLTYSHESGCFEVQS